MASRLGITSKVFKNTGSSLVAGIIVTGLSLYMIVFTILIVYRVVNDDATGCRGLLYLHNVNTGIYATSLYLFFSLLMIGVGVICVAVIFALNIVTPSKLGSIALSFLVAALQNAMCSLFIAILVNQTCVSRLRLTCSIFGVIVVIAFNILGYAMVSSSTLTSYPLILAAIPGY